MASPGPCKEPPRPQRRPKITESGPEHAERSKRMPVDQRWYYETVQTPVLANHVEQGTTTGITETDDCSLDDETESMVENILRATDKYEAAIAQQPGAAYNNKIYPIGGKCFNELVTLDKDVSELPEILGPMVLITNEELLSLPMDEDGARQLQGILFYDKDLSWCRITGWGVENSIPIVFYSPLLAENIVHGEEYVSLEEMATRLKQSEIYPVLPKFKSSRVLKRSEVSRLNLCYKQLSYKAVHPEPPSVGFCTPVVSGDQVGSHNGLTLTDRTIKRILRAQETIFKYGTLIPRNDAEARRSPEAIRWMSGQQLEWIRLNSAKTFENQWTWEKVRKAYPSYKKDDIGHMFFIYDYKLSGEHRVRLVFDGSRQSEATYKDTYAITNGPA